MKEYVVGFIHQMHPIRGWGVWLIHKKRPEWQKGLWNGLGGKVELTETPPQAMRREGLEECGLDLKWTPFARTHWPDQGAVVYFFWTFLDRFPHQTPETKTDEEVQWFSLQQLDDTPLVDWTRSFINLSLDHKPQTFWKVEIDESAP